MASRYSLTCSAEEAAELEMRASCRIIGVVRATQIEAAKCLGSTRRPVSEIKTERSTGSA